jgi:polyketide synthase PksN
MLLLKRLAAAERDRDHIYAVLRSSAENHGGRANSLTAPNPTAQAELIKQAYAQAGIDPRTVSYIEAHGTGTALGDPIEINALKKAFQELYEIWGDRRPANAHCGLGSVKTNIGHLELAAGVAGVIKVLLQFQHKTLVKSLHCDEVNPYIHLDGSPFYLMRQTQPWRQLQDAHGKDLPRRAGVSSFGFGGVNAHLVLEEYVRSENHRRDAVIVPERPALVALSAKRADRLKEQTKQFLEAISTRGLSDADLADLAYTLQVGRDAMEQRVALTARSMKELQEKLQQAIDGQETIGNLYRGEVKPNKDALSVVFADEDLQKIIEVWIEKGKYDRLLELWVKGLEVDWNKLYAGAKPRRISLPTYPFATERYWIPKSAERIENLAQNNGGHQFDETFINQLLEDVINDTVSIDTAAIRTMKAFERKNVDSTAIHFSRSKREEIK